MLLEFIDSDWVKEVTIRPCYVQLWIDWVLDDGKSMIEINPHLDYTQAWSFDHAWNEGQKNGSNLGKRNNQNFVVIPTGRLIERLKQLCPEYGIKLTITEESYTSKASFLDDDFLPKYGKKSREKSTVLNLNNSTFRSGCNS